MGSIGDNQLAALSGYTGTIQDRIRKALVNPPTETGTIDDLGGYLGRTVFWSSPADETNLVGWYTPDSIDVTGSDVTQWNDTSGEANHLSDTTGVYPQNTGLIGGVACVKFSNTVYISTTATYSQPMTVFIVAQDSVANFTRNLFSGHLTSGTRYVGGTSATNYAFNFGNTVNITYTRDTDPHVFSFVINGASSSMYVDGTLIGSGNVGALGFQRITLGGIINPFQGWDGDIAEAVFINEAADATTHNRNGQYLADIYGTTWNAVS